MLENMNIDKLKALKEKISKESSVKQEMRRKNESCFIPRSYYIFGYTARYFFKKKLLETIREVEKNEKVR